MVKVSKKRAKTERVAMRLPTTLIAKLDEKVAAGEYRSRTQLIFEAVRDYLKQQGA